MEKRGKMWILMQVLRKTHKSTIPQIQRALEVPRKCPGIWEWGWRTSAPEKHGKTWENMGKTWKKCGYWFKFWGKLTNPKSSGSARECPGIWATFPSWKAPIPTLWWFLSFSASQNPGNVSPVYFWFPTLQLPQSSESMRGWKKLEKEKFPVFEIMENVVVVAVGDRWIWDGSKGVWNDPNSSHWKKTISPELLLAGRIPNIYLRCLF